MKFENPTYDGTEFDLSHLGDFEHTYEVKEKPDGGTKRFRCHVTFSNHVFTKSLTKTSEPNNCDMYENREFCPERYGLSKLLPDLIKKIGDKQCKDTGKGNYARFEVFDDSGETKNYEIYFKVSKTRKGWINITIQSAYVRTNVTNLSQARRKMRNIRFAIIIRNAMKAKKN